jgi:hypothetical protein
VEACVWREVEVVGVGDVASLNPRGTNLTRKLETATVTPP